MEFLKILWDNLKKGPVTDAFPFGETYTPDRLRGRVEIDPALCVGCGTCVHVCAAGAINISKFEDGSGFEITVWRNSCCLCAQCRHYCPTKAVTLTNDWHSAHRATEKYTQITRAKVKYDYCAVCGAKMRVLPQEVLNRIYAKHSEVDVDVISHLCPNCRRIDVAVEEDRACHIDQLEKMAAREEVCLVPPRKAEKASADKESAKEAPAQAASARKQPHPRGKLRHSPSPTLRLPRRRRAPRRLRLNRPLPQQPKRGPIRLPARKAPLKNRLRRRATPPTEPTYRYDARRNLHEYDMVKPFHQSRARQGAGGAGFRRTA